MGEDSQTNSKVFRVRIVSIDFYMASPIPDLDICYSSFHGENAKEVPVIRVYGPTPAGQKTCLHIHRVLPYFYVACSEIPLESNLQGDAYLNAVSLAFEKALKLRGNVGSKRQHVHGCSLVRAKMLYGYHASEDLFIKIYLYYPHDVSRAANLLLDGAVFDRSLQPYESHIPFLLQFMVDYNLYGMGHLHLAKMKFRHPVPDDFHSRKVQSIGAYDTSCTPANSQADSVGSLCSDSPIWRASTIPNNCTWQCSSKLSASLNQDSHPVKRQSICELELDTTVDDILNQQFKMYTSLSQTGSDTKMVQSLVSLWEEEYERSGTHETEVLAQLGGLSPKDVLRTLSDGLDYEKKLLELCDKAHQTLSTRSSNDVKLQLARSVSEVKGVDGETQNQDRVTLEGTGLQEKSHISISVVSELQEHGGNSSGEGRGKCISSAVEMLSSKITEDHDSMPVKEDALTILEWLASTQALEDVNSDDELVRETILSPLLQAETISKVLEKANLYYESESQQECQDILDSVVDVVNFNNLRQKSSVDENMSSAVISDKMIPQVDGAGDDDPSTPLARSSKVKKDIKLTSSQSKMSESSSSVSSRKRKRDTLQWGSLPLSEHKSVSRDVHTASREASDNFHDEIGGETFDAGSLARDERQIDSVDLSHSCSSASFQHLVDTRVLHGCSVRDLMRKKRCHRDAGSEWGNSRHKEDSSAEVLCLSKLDSCQELFKVQDLQIPQGFAARSLYSEHQTEFCGTIISTSRNGFEMTKDNSQYHKRKEHEVKTTSSHTCARDLVPLVEQGPKISDDNFFVGGDSQKKLSLHPRCLSPCNPEVKVLHKYDNGGKAGGGVISEDLFTDTEPQVLEETNVVAVASQSVHSSCAKFGRSDFSKSLAAPDKMPFGCSYAKNCKNLHPDGQICKESENVLVSAAIANIPGEDDHNYKEHSVKGRSLDVLLPLFSDDSVQHYKVRSCSQSSNDVASKPAGSVPIQCKKDVPYSYLLTPLSSPPSADSVFRWLSLRETGALKADSDAELSLSSSPESNAIQKLSSQTNVSSASKLIYNQKNEDKHKIPDVKEHILYKEMGILIQEENKVENVMKSSPDRSQISGPSGRSKPTPLSQIGFRDPASIGKGQQLTLLSIEVQAEARGELQPDPQFDAINIIALAIQNDSSPVVDVQILMRTAAKFCGRNIDAISGCKLFSFCEEKDLMDHFMKIVDSYDPDILIGWDVQGGSLGFLAERAFQLGIGLLNKISRASSETKMADSDPGVVLREKMVHVASDSLTTDTIKLGEDTIIEDEWGRTHMSGVRVGGRIVLNVWRLMRSEVKLNMYSVEAVTQAVLRRKVPSIHCKVLHKWYSSGPGRARYQCIEYIICRAKLNLEIMNQLDMINRTSELARIFGIDFFSVLSRGSQYRVESMMIRLAHTQNYVAISPGYQQVASQPAMECQPLVMEPESGFYADPVVVLDFQSLYPSMLIAYNLCFSTCLGKIVPSKPDMLGVSTYSPDLHVIRDVNEEILLTPNGVMYVPTKSRKGILPRLLEEILSTRIMVKKAMKKLTPSQQILHRILDARQLALKLIANVTYGYTAAGFSGRMPCAELADSIVQCGRRTLENAISFVNSHTKWDARVVYGDTDSMFVLLKGRTLKEAFLIGREIASSITALNPYPVTLKMEKVYQPCFLLTKKRYVGYSFETVDQVKPMFDAKGIETVRRDTCGAVSKIMERSLRLFFEHQEIFKVRAYLQRQWSRILSGRLSVEDFVFAKEVRLGTYRATSFSSLPPAAIVATKALRADPRAEPRYAERVPYVVVHGEPGSRLVDMVVDPLDLLAIDSPYRLNDLYYINKQIIPALQRVFGLIGADLNQWFLEMPRPVRDAPNKHQFSVLNPQRTRIDYYYLSRHCVLCGQLVHLSNHLCDLCSLNGAAATAVITGRTSKLEREIQHLASICRHCGGGDWIVESGVKCTSLACSVFYERRKIQKELLALSTVATDAGLYPKCMAEWF